MKERTVDGDTPDLPVSARVDKVEAAVDTVIFNVSPV